MPMNINVQLRDFLLKHRHYVARFENGTIGRMVEPYNRAKTELMTRIADLEDFGQGFTLQHRIDRLTARMSEVDAVLQNATDRSIGNLRDDLRQFSSSEADYVNRLLEDRYAKPLGVNLVRIPYEQVDRMVEMPLGGLTYAERMRQNYGRAMVDMKAELTQAIIHGQDMAKASRRLLGVGTSLGGRVGSRILHQSQVIARTEIMRVSNDVSRGVYNANKDVIKGVQWISTLDKRTCLLPWSAVLTDKEMKMISDIDVGDFVLTDKERWRKVTGKFKQTRKGYYKVRLSNGRALCVTGDHEVICDGLPVRVDSLSVGQEVDGKDV